MWHYPLELGQIVIPPDGKKTCTSCKQIKDISEFPDDKYKRDGKKPHCAICHAAKNQARRDQDPHWHPAIQENYRARQYGKEGRVSPSERRMIFERDKVCKTCGSDQELELDHIVSLISGGEHCVENLQVLCKTCNTRKGG